jgi:hypothetical protein
MPTPSTLVSRVAHRYALVSRVAHRFAASHEVFASKALARSWPELVSMVEKDAQAVGHWRKKFVSESLAILKKGRADSEAMVKGPWWERYPDAVKGNLKDIEFVFSTVEKNVKKLETKMIDEPLAGHEVSQIHMDHWDPEMFADGQTKADYGRKPIDPIFEAVQAVTTKYHEFWKRFNAKYDLGSLNVTLYGLLPASLNKKSRLNFELIQKLDGEDLEKALHWYSGELEKLAKEVEKEGPPGAANALSVGAGLSALMGEAKKKGDQWTADFAKSLMGQAERRHPFSDKQRSLLDAKLHEYHVPPVNYTIWW